MTDLATYWWRRTTKAEKELKAALNTKTIVLVPKGDGQIEVLDRVSKGE